jgi:hypothetical protein
MEALSQLPLAEVAEAVVLFFAILILFLLLHQQQALQLLQIQADTEFMYLMEAGV